ncbi:hypothetical protein CerSpe_068400 [Prunus speciosa]
MAGDKFENFQIAPEKLTGRVNYDSWARAARISIASKKKLGYITGTKKAPKQEDVEAYEDWEEENCTVQTWLLNAMEKHVRALFDRLTTAKAIWNAVEKTYSVSNNSSKIYELTKRSVNNMQAGRTLEAYYEELQIIWQELDAINPPQIKNEIDLCTHLVTVTNFRVYILLAGLDSHLDATRAHVLRSDPLPDVLETYAMICEEDVQLKTMWSEEKISGSAMATRKGFQGPDRTSFAHPPKSASASKPVIERSSALLQSSVKHNGSSSTKDEHKCTYCGKNHTIDKCWKLHGSSTRCSRKDRNGMQVKKGIIWIKTVSLMLVWKICTINEEVWVQTE